jgi:hypothetical protein
MDFYSIASLLLLLRTASADNGTVCTQHEEANDQLAIATRMAAVTDYKVCT